MTKKTCSALLVACCVALGATACGESEQDQIKNTITTYFQSSIDRDVDSICETTTGYDQIKNSPEEGKSCQEIISQGFKNGGASDKADLEEWKQKKADAEIKIDGDKATVKLRGESEVLPLIKKDGKWKIDIMGFSNQSVS